jgi:hypothetical protein
VPQGKIILNDVRGIPLSAAQSLFSITSQSMYDETIAGGRRAELYSPSGLTVAVYEDASDASPNSQIVLFQRQGETPLKWTSRAVEVPIEFIPPSLAASARPIRVDDTSIYFQYRRGKVVISKKLSDLTPLEGKTGRS